MVIRIKQKGIGFTEDQIEFMEKNKYTFNLNKFCRDKLDEYIEEREVIWKDN